jgi:hypothetical protein
VSHWCLAATLFVREDPRHSIYCITGTWVVSVAPSSWAREELSKTYQLSLPSRSFPWGRGRERRNRGPKGWGLGPTHICGLDDEVAGQAVPQHGQHVLLLALALPNQEVSGVCQQLSHLRPRDGPMVPQLLLQRLLHLWNELQRWGELGGDEGEECKGHLTSWEATGPAGISSIPISPQSYDHPGGTQNLPQAPGEGSGLTQAHSGQSMDGRLGLADPSQAGALSSRTQGLTTARQDETGQSLLVPVGQKGEGQEEGTG